MLLRSNTSARIIPVSGAPPPGRSFSISWRSSRKRPADVFRQLTRGSGRSVRSAGGITLRRSAGFQRHQGDSLRSRWQPLHRFLLVRADAGTATFGIGAIARYDLEGRDNKTTVASSVDKTAHAVPDRSNWHRVPAHGAFRPKSELLDLVFVKSAWGRWPCRRQLMV